MTWAHKYGDMGILQSGGTDSYEDMQQRLRSGYMPIADSLEAVVAPCGWVWRKLIQTYPAIELYSADNYHPAENGTYLAACTFFASIFKQTAVGINYVGNILPSDAAIFQSVASQIVLDSLGLWNIGLYNPKPTANFGYLQSGNQLIFSDSSSLASNYYWDFGDGFSSIVQNPTHIYVANGSYNVSLISRNSCDADTITKTIQYISTNINHTISNKFIVYPNPITDKISIVSPENEIKKKIIITQMDGKQVYIDENEHIKINELKLSNLKKGVYNLIIYTKNSSFTEKIVII